MKKWKPWILSLTTFVVMSTGITAIATNVQNIQTEQNNKTSNLNTDKLKPNIKNSFIQSKKPGDPNSLKLSDLDVNNDGLKIKEPNFKKKYTQIKPSIWIDNFANTKNNGNEFRQEFLGAFVSDFNNAYSGMVGANSFNLDVTVKIESATSWRQKFKNEISDLIQVNNKAVDYLNELNKGTNNNFSDLSTRTQAFYDKRKIIDDTNQLYLQHHHDAWSRSVLGGYTATSGSSFIQDGTAEQSLKNLLNSSKTLVEDYYIDPNNAFGLGSLYTVVRFRFDTNKRLNLNSLDKYISVDINNGTFEFNLYNMQTALDGWTALTDKDRVFVNNGLHDYFDVTYDTFWNKVKEVVTQKGLDISSLNNASFKSSNIYKSKNAELNTRNGQTITDIIDDPDNTISGSTVSKSGWKQPTLGSGGNLYQLTYKVDMKIPKYQETNDSFVNRMNVNVTQQDDLTNAKIKSNELNTKKSELDTIKKAIENSTNQFSKIKIEIENSKKNWEEELKKIIGDKNGGPTQILKQQYDKILNDFKQELSGYENELKKIQEKYNLDKTIYRPHDWIWLQAIAQVSKEDSEKLKNINNKLISINQETLEKLNALFKDPAIIQELTTKRNESLSSLSETLKTLEKVKTTLESELNKITNSSSGLKYYLNQVKNLQDTITSTITINVNQNNMQLYVPKNVDTSDSWITKQDRWWTMYNPSGSANNNGQRTRYIFDKDQLMKDINQKIIDDIKNHDNDFSIQNDSTIIKPELISNMSGVGDQTDNGATITLGSGEHEYKISPVLKYRLEAVQGTSDLKINNMQIEITAVNQWIERFKENTIKELEQQVKDTEQQINDLLNKQDNISYQSLKKKIKDLQNVNVTSEINQIIGNGQYYQLTEEYTNRTTEIQNMLNGLSISPFAHKKLNPLFLIVFIIVLIVLLILLILLLVWLKKSNYRYRYVV